MSSRRALVVAATVIIAALIGGTLIARSLLQSGASPPPPAFVPTASEKAILALLNVQRAKYHLTPLKYDAVLGRFARAHSVSMAAHNYFEHDQPGGPTYAQRAQSILHLPGRNRMEENIAWGNGGYGTPSALVTSWMNSPGHRANILNPLVHRAGEGNVVTKKTYQSQPPGVVIATTEFSN